MLPSCSTSTPQSSPACPCPAHSADLCKTVRCSPCIERPDTPHPSAHQSPSVANQPLLLSLATALTEHTYMPLTPARLCVLSTDLPHPSAPLTYRSTYHHLYKQHRPPSATPHSASKCSKRAQESLLMPSQLPGSRLVGTDAMKCNRRASRVGQEQPAAASSAASSPQPHTPSCACPHTHPASITLCLGDLPPKITVPTGMQHRSHNCHLC